MVEVSGLFLLVIFLSTRVQLYIVALAFFMWSYFKLLLGAIPSDDQIRLTPSMTNKKG